MRSEFSLKTTTMWPTYTVVYVCIYVWLSHVARVRINPGVTNAARVIKEN